MRRDIAAINGLRGLSILGVIYYHLIQSTITGPGFGKVVVGSMTLFPLAILSNGYQAVTWFFLLSGIVLMLPYADGRRHMRSLHDVLAFYRRRALRLGPLLLLCIAVSSIISAPSAREILPGMGGMVLDILNPVPVEVFPRYNWVLWSLRVELWFAVIFPFLVISMRRWGAEIVTLTVIVLVLLLRVWIIFHWEEGGRRIVDTIFGRLDQFVIGMGLASALVKDPVRLRSRVWLAWGCVFLLFCFHLSDASSMHLAPYLMLSPMRMLLIDCGLFLVTAPLVAGLPGMAKNIIEWKPLQLTGIACYSAYVWHGAFFHPMRSQSDVPHAVAHLLVVIVVSAITYRFVERHPFLTHREARSPHPPSRPDGTSPMSSAHPR